MNLKEKVIFCLNRLLDVNRLYNTPAAFSTKGYLPKLSRVNIYPTLKPRAKCNVVNFRRSIQDLNSDFFPFFSLNQCKKSVRLTIYPNLGEEKISPCLSQEQ